MRLLFIALVIKKPRKQKDCKDCPFLQCTIIFYYSKIGQPHFIIYILFIFVQQRTQNNNMCALQCAVFIIYNKQRMNI